MKRYSCLGLMVATFVSLALGQVKHGFALTLHAPTGAVKLGSQIRLRITVTNHSRHDLTFAKSPGEEDDVRYDIEARDEAGGDVSPTEYYRALQEHRAIVLNSSVAFVLKPGNSFVDEIEVTKFYKMNRPGKYKLWVSRTVSDATARSNIVTITVVK